VPSKSFILTAFLAKPPSRTRISKKRACRAFLTTRFWEPLGGANNANAALRYCRICGMQNRLASIRCSLLAVRTRPSGRARRRSVTVADLFATWWEKHRDRPIAVRQLHDDVKQAADPQGRGRQHLASQLEKLAGTRIAGFVLSRQAPAAKWGGRLTLSKRLAGARAIGVIGGFGPRRSRSTKSIPAMPPMLAEASNAPMAPMPPKRSPTSSQSAPSQNDTLGRSARL
jgi:hypothetical protein